jgi:hypothetical protein
VPHAELRSDTGLSVNGRMRTHPETRVCPQAGLAALTTKQLGVWVALVLFRVIVPIALRGFQPPNLGMMSMAPSVGPVAQAQDPQSTSKVCPVSSDVGVSNIRWSRHR